ncbi:MAG: hypothetical protein JWM95_4376 [Gemmatimonadetes bacterium]|nr:hypothetical protein [Gemmatimonadota bacterium]
MSDAGLSEARDVVLSEAKDLLVLVCSNCGSVQARVYCAECGERQPTQRDFTTRALAAEAASEFVSREMFARQFNDTLNDQKKSILLVAIPVFAVMLAVLSIGSGRSFVEHSVFAVHSYAFMVFYMLAIGTVGFLVLIRATRILHAPASIFKFLYSETALLLVIGIGMVWYLKSALRRYYGSSELAALARALVLFSVQGYLIATFHIVLFHTVLLSL